ALTLKRLKELSYRVLASDGLSKGYDFRTTFDMIHNQYKLNRNEAFSITLRAHRGGGFTKDRLYLSGLKKVYELYKSGLSLDLLLSGKVSIDYLDSIKYLEEIGLLAPIIHKNYAFEQDENSNKTLDFILRNLK
ncbi:MAG: flavohemoglobin expression-modulating QEGLA motif protein, partial [Flavobacteriaceae bacterium]|nr:flavohemoglobin expression-modulating QEGLA motif protein [Flavobacteriaceae bacterium]